MQSLRVKKTLNAPPSAVWAALDDFGGVHRYHPKIESSPITNGVAKGLGAARACHFYGGGAIHEEVVGYEEGRSIGVALTDPGSFPLRQATATVEVTDAGDGRSEVTVQMDFVPKYGPLGTVMALVMMKPMFRRLLGQMLEGLDAHLQTGRIVGEGGQLLQSAA